MMKKATYIFLFSLLTYFTSYACQCPQTSLSLAECKKYEIIFRGRVDSVKKCNNNFGVAYFTIDELYKGNATKQFRVLFECGQPCSLDFMAGEEWIIYTRYKQIDNAMMDWCSRSRKFFKVEKQDYYTVNYGNDYDDEVTFLRSNLGMHRVVAEKKNSTEGRNERPSTTGTIILLLCSLSAVILFYWLFNKFFKF